MANLPSTAYTANNRMVLFHRSQIFIKMDAKYCNVTENLHGTYSHNFDDGHNFFLKQTLTYCNVFQITLTIAFIISHNHPLLKFIFECLHNVAQSYIITMFISLIKNIYILPPIIAFLCFIALYSHPSFKEFYQTVFIIPY